MSDELRIIPTHPQYLATADGRISSTFKRGFLTIFTNKDGYPATSLRDKAVYPIHHLVAAAWLGPRPDGLQVCHKDGVKANCHKDNIYYGTPQQNSDDRVKHGNSCAGESNGYAKLTREIVTAIRIERARGDKLHVLAKRYNVSLGAISAVVNKHTWRSV